MTHLCVPIFVSSREQARRDALLAAENGADLVEYRIDAFTDTANIDLLVYDSPLPCILTCRSSAEGGRCDLSDEERIKILNNIGLGFASGKPTRSDDNRRITVPKTPGPHAPRYVDLELQSFRRLCRIDKEINAAGTLFPKSALILSSHDFSGRPDRLYNLVAEMNASPANVVKIVWTARTIRDNLEAFEILLSRQKSTIALCMGEAGLLSRILAKKFGAFLTFASLSASSQTAPGQVNVRDMKRLYRWDAINAGTKVFGVVGSPVAHSMSPALHNAAFERIGFDGVYLPLAVNEGYESFKAFMESFLAFKPLHLSGLSITIPHKENALRYLKEKGAEIDPLAQSIGALNTIVIGAGPLSVVSGPLSASNAAAGPDTTDNGQRTTDALQGFSTDYSAILDSITAKLNITREKLADFRIAVLGAGGTGRTAVAALAQCGATVVIYNRTFEKAGALAAEFNGRSGKVVAARFEKLADSCCRIFINTTPVGMFPKADASPIDGLGVVFTPEHLVFDTIYNPITTRLLQTAQTAGAATISGIEMFVRQAAAQFEAWTHKTAPLDLMRKVVEDRLKESVG